VVKLSASLLLAVAAVSLVAGYYWWLSSRPATLTVVVPVGWLRGRYVAGFVQAVASAPTGFVERTVFVDLQRGGAATVSLRLPVSRLLQALRPGSGGLAAVHVNLYLYTQDGGLCISAATIDTLHYTYRLMGANEKAVRSALQHPDAVLMAGLLTFSRGLFTPCVPLSKVLARFVAPRLREILRHPKIRAPSSSVLGFVAGERLLLVNPALLDAANKPPESWLEHVTPSGYAKMVWHVFASRYSYAVLVPKWHSLDTALWAAASWYLLSPPKKAPNGKAAYGLMPMNSFITSLYSIYGYEPSLHWRNHLKPGTILRHFDKAPIVVLNTTCPTCPYYSYERMEVLASFATAEWISIKYGVSILGVIVLPHSTDSMELQSQPARGMLIPGGDVEAIYAPMDDVYESDGMLVVLYVGSYRDNGIDYWMIVPVFSPVVLHYYRFDYKKLGGARVRPGSEILDALRYMTRQYDVAEHLVVTPRNVTIKQMCIKDDFYNYITLDSFGPINQWSNSWAAFMAYTANAALWRIAANILAPEYAPFISVASYLVSIAYMDSYAAAQSFKLVLTSGQTGHTIDLTAYKLTQRYMTSNDVSNGIYPTLAEYIIRGKDYYYSSSCGTG